MRGILNCVIGDVLVVENIGYTVTSKSDFLLNNTKAFRITLNNNHENIFLEIKREMALNYQIFKYSLIDSIKSNKNFLSVLGTNTLGYNNPKLSTNNIYKKVRFKKERYSLIKHIVLEDELPEDFALKGYHKDEYGNYYFFTKKYSPLIKEFHDSRYKVWEYRQQDENLRLLVETKMQKGAGIFIYKGKELKNSQVTLLGHDRVSKTPLQPQMNQTQDTLHQPLIYR